MNPRAGTNNLKARLRRLEDRVGQGRRNCPQCRLSVRSLWPDPTKPRARPEDFVMAKCEFCHTTNTIYLGYFPEEEREGWRLWLSFTLEFWYLNPKAQALGLWLEHQPTLGRSRPKEQWQQHLQRGTVAPPLRQARGQTPGQRLVSRLQQEENDLLERKFRILRAMYGEGCFRNQQELIESVRARAEAERKGRAHVKGLERLEGMRVNYLICAELEKIIWGDVRSKTSISITALESLIDARIKAKEEEEAQIKEQNEAERRRRDEAENMSRAEERQKKIKLENSYRRRLKLPQLPDDYEGDFTSYPDLMRIRPHPPFGRTIR